MQKKIGNHEAFDFSLTLSYFQKGKVGGRGGLNMTPFPSSVSFGITFSKKNLCILFCGFRFVLLLHFSVKLGVNCIFDCRVSARQLF